MSDPTDTPTIDAANENAAPSKTLPDPAAHLDTFRAAELEDTAPADDVLAVDENGDPVAVQIDPEQVTKDGFYLVFEKAFWFPGAFMPPLAPLAIQPGHETTVAREASDAIYEILEIYWPGALMPQSDMLARLAAIVPFAMIKYMTVRTLLAELRRPREVAPPEFNTRRKETSADFQGAQEGQRAPDRAANDNEVPHLDPGIFAGFAEAS